jgi:hypothetical protein
MAQTATAASRGHGLFVGAALIGSRCESQALYLATLA